MEHLTQKQQDLINSWDIDEEMRQFFIKLYTDDNKLIKEKLKINK